MLWPREQRSAKAIHGFGRRHGSREAEITEAARELTKCAVAPSRAQRPRRQGDDGGGVAMGVIVPRQT